MMTKYTVQKPAVQSGASASDRLELIQTFVRIVQAGSLSAAAAQLGTTQPTVSRRLQLLERSLGVRLLQRSTHAMKMTEDGERCFDRAKDLLAGWEAFESDLRGDDAEVDGSLKVLVPHAFGQEQLIGPLAQFMHNHPRVSVEWLLRDRAADFISEGIDCAIHVGKVTDPSMVVIKLAEVPRMIAVAPVLLAAFPTPVHARELAAMPWLAIPNFYLREVILDHIESGEVCQFPIRPRLVTDNLFALRNAAVTGMGVFIGSSWMLTEQLQAGALVQLLPEWRAAPLPVSVVYPYARQYPARLRRFIETMRDVMPAAVNGAIGWPKSGL
jgi:DNA-binding transcriptional LysR family regulator